MLILNNISFEREKNFEWLINPKTNYPLYLDFYLPEYNIAIECQGRQHFKPINFFGGLKAFENEKYKDKLKHELCSINNLKILYYSNIVINNYLDKIYNNLYEIRENIKKS